MFAYIKGVLNFKSNDYIIIETGGIGYKIFTSLSTIEMSGALGTEIQVFTHFYVREDAVNLFGFLTNDELNMFELLISVSGVGPKAAISLLSAVTPSRFGLAVITDDVKTLTRAQGIGAKTAQRIILELKDKIKKEQLSSVTEVNDELFDSSNEGSKSAEAVSALMVLGYSQLEAARAVTSIYTDDMDIEAVIKGALKKLARS